MLISFLNPEMKTVTFLAIASIAFGQAPNPQVRPPRPPSTQSPASKARPKSATAQHYSADQVREGEVRFGSQCGFCHGKDAAGGETGPDLTRAELVAQDSQGDKLAPVIRAGRPNAGMPAFPSLTSGELNAIVAFLHTQMDKFAELGAGGAPSSPPTLPPATPRPAARTSKAPASARRATRQRATSPASPKNFRG
jgi:cytochrome c oxidase cbb3-type subunit 3